MLCCMSTNAVCTLYMVQYTEKEHVLNIIIQLITSMYHVTLREHVYHYMYSPKPTHPLHVLPNSHPLCNVVCYKFNPFPCPLPPPHTHTHIHVCYSGQFSEVHECLHCSTQQSYAAKLIPLTLGDHAHRELEMLSRLSHPNIVNVTAAYQTDQHYIFLFQL